MRFARPAAALFVLFLAAACGGGGSSSPPAPGGGGNVGGGATSDNVVPVTVVGTPTSRGLYINKPAVSVTVCTPGGVTCQTINDILLDTGSYGLRVFRNVLTVPLAPVTNGAGTVAECIQYADGTSSWGPIANASVVLGNEPGVQVPIQLIDSTFAGRPASCTNPDVAPSSAGFNGILGVGIFAEDCGTGCARFTTNGVYFACSGGVCSGTTVLEANQVRNPVDPLPLDNNGVIVELPAVAPGGAATVSGSLILGIDTRSNNASGAVTTYPASGSTGDFQTSFNGTTYPAFIDTGSNAYFFPGTFPDCTTDPGWFCPPTSAGNTFGVTGLTATTIGSGGSPSGSVPFNIGNFTALFDTGNHVFSDVGAPDSTIGGHVFDWGLPFFFNRNVYVGIDGKSSGAGTGPYWAY